MKVNKAQKLLISIVVCIVISIAVISIFKGSHFVLVKYYYYSGFSKHKSKDLQGAIADYTKALSYDKSNTASYISRGSALVDLKKYNEAIEDYSIAIKQTPNDPHPYAFRGRAYYEINEYEKAMLDYEKALKLDDKFAFAYYNRGLLKYTIYKDFKSRCEDFRKAVSFGENQAQQFIDKKYCE